MPVPLMCPITKEPLVPQGQELLAPRTGRRYPIVSGVPVLLPSESECARVARAAWEGGGTTGTPLDFYNSPDNFEQFSRETLEGERAAIGSLAARAPAGPHLEIGVGRGVLQGIGSDYVALDYSHALLMNFISGDHQRVCATAEHIPFPDQSFSMIYSVAALEHVPAPDLAFEEIHRVLMPGGALFLAPAWHCMQDNCEGIPVRPYGELTLRQKARKVTLLLRRSLPWKALIALPPRVARRLLWTLGGGVPTALRYRRLRPDYSRFWMSDSDAVSCLDSHEGALFFHSRGYRVESPGTDWWRQLLASHAPLVAWKPE